jgi:energy-coupling factor transporter ATP-binding protein EcfA2
MSSENITRFNLSSIRPGSFTIVTGKRASGKTTLIIDILKQLSTRVRNNNIYLFTSDQSSIHQYNENFPNIKCTNDYIEKLLYNRSKEEEELIFVFEDYSASKIVRTNVFERLIIHGRHLNITTIMTHSSEDNIPPRIISNVDYVFSFKENLMSNCKRLFVYFFELFNSYNRFIDVFNAFTNNLYTCLVVDNTHMLNINYSHIFYYNCYQSLNNVQIHYESDDESENDLDDYLDNELPTKNEPVRQATAPPVRQATAPPVRQATAPPVRQATAPPVRQASTNDVHIHVHVHIHDDRENNNIRNQ